VESVEMTDKGIEQITDMLTVICLMVYDITLVAGTAYLVQEHNWSMWTFLLTMCFFLIPRKKNEQKEATL
jgi:hypothetical protein